MAAGRATSESSICDLGIECSGLLYWGDDRESLHSFAKNSTFNHNKNEQSTCSGIEMQIPVLRLRR